MKEMRTLAAEEKEMMPKRSRRRRGVRGSLGKRAAISLEISEKAKGNSEAAFRESRGGGGGGSWVEL